MHHSVKRSPLWALGLFFVTFSAQAHTGHTAYSWMEGILHPFGADHLLAMVAVGIWSASSLSHRQMWRGPAGFMLTLLAGAWVGSHGITAPLLELAVALSVVLFGALLWASRSAHRHTQPGWLLLLVAGCLHGMAHGSETPNAGFTAYAFGFLFTTTWLHMFGIAVGSLIKRWALHTQTRVLQGLGSGMGVVGLYLLTQA